MPYLRHRPRLIRQSVFEDLKQVLDDLEWIPSVGWSEGDPWDSSQVLGLLSSPLILTDYFPVAAIYQGEKVESNTLAIDAGTPQEPRYVEMGSDAREQNYLFNLALFAESDAVALSLFSDLSDRYLGVTPGDVESVTLFNYNEATPTPVVDMEVLSFETAPSPEQPAPGKMLWFAQLVLTDYLESD